MVAELSVGLNGRDHRPINTAGNTWWTLFYTTWRGIDRDDVALRFWHTSLVSYVIFFTRIIFVLRCLQPLERILWSLLSSGHVQKWLVCMDYYEWVSVTARIRIRPATKHGTQRPVPEARHCWTCARSRMPAFISEFAGVQTERCHTGVAGVLRRCCVVFPRV